MKEEREQKKNKTKQKNTGETLVKKRTDIER
jgi:hypothetical protein